MKEIIDASGAEILIGDLPQVDGYPGQLKVLFQNLIHNATKFRSDKKPSVRIYSLGSEGGLNRIAVEDNGIGFDERYEDLILQPFQQLHSRDSRYEGTRIGLAICRKVVEHHKGFITATSIPGQGSTFIIGFPSSSPTRKLPLIECS